MNFILGLAFGAALSHSPQPSAESVFVNTIPAICVAAQNYDEYVDCRWPSLWDELHYGPQRHYCDDAPRTNECNMDRRAGYEWRTILRLRGITPR